MIKLSVVIITFNEERNIERCLSSVTQIADEIVVLDSFSTDQTPSICAKHGVNFFQHAFDGHIQQKNRAISYASHPHVLSLDADEATALQYLRKQEFSLDTSIKGWALIQFKQLPLGWVKILPNRINNYYPKEWRILNK